MRKRKGRFWKGCAVGVGMTLAATFIVIVAVVDFFTGPQLAVTSPLQKLKGSMNPVS